jgi:hypothetical protein
MRISTLLPAAALLVPLAASAAPLKRGESGIDSSTVLVLQFAFVLENFETQFYHQALNTFQPSDYSNAGFMSSEIVIEEITIIESDESVHVTAIEEIITSVGQMPMQCQFDFSSVLTDVSTMVNFAQVVENVGVGAYLGAAHLVQDPRVLTAAASIATIEARHQSVLNLFQGMSPIPQPFDIPLLPNEVLAIAGSFIHGCDLGIKANPPLSVTNTGSIVVGTSLQFSSSAFSGSPSGYHCQMLVGGLPFSISLPIDQCVVPQGISGAVAIWITSDDQPLNGGAVDRQSNAIVAGPLMAFIGDSSSPDAMGSLFRQSSGSSAAASCGSSCGNSSSTSTTTVSPSQANSMIMSALSSQMASMTVSASNASMTLASNASAPASASDVSAMASASGAMATASASVASASASTTDASAAASSSASAASVTMSM